MGTLLDRDGRDHILAASHLIGRSQAARLQLAAPRVSWEHAAIRWTGEVWELRDLGSTNGTWVDGDRLERGACRALHAGSVLGFGHDDDDAVLTEASPPSVMAVGPGGREVHAAGNLLALPSESDPQVMVYPHAELGWVVETDAGIAAVREGEPLLVGDTPWVLHVPEVRQPTLRMSEASRDLASATLLFRVSLDEEYIELDLLWGDDKLELGHRVHHYLLLELARKRRADVEQGISPGSAGWLHPDTLISMLKLDLAAINTYVFRSRRGLTDADVPRANAIVERRAGTRELRLGTDRFRVETI